VIISYSAQAMEALDGLAVTDRGAYLIAIQRIQVHVAALAGDGVFAATVVFTVDDGTFTVNFVAVLTGVEVAVHELDWQVRGI
jgi:hypothetical protein